MQLALKIAGTGVFLVVIAYFILRIWIGGSVKENIAYAKDIHQGTAEEALIAMLRDNAISTNDKTHIAVWTLGQLHSEKVLPLFKELYKDDPEGKTCYGNHDNEICQYELYNAIEAIEGSKFFTHARLNQ